MGVFGGMSGVGTLSGRQQYYHQQQQQIIPLSSGSSSGNSANNKKHQQQRESQQTRCHCAVDELLAPLRKMKVLKKLKKRMGLVPRSAGINNNMNNLPPLRFHDVHGDNIEISNGGSVAKRSESFCKGITFSNRPIKIGERVCIKFLEISTNWSGVIRFGFTTHDPSTLRGSLPRYACPELTKKSGSYAKALAEMFVEQGTVLYYYVTHAGDVHFGINGEDKGFFISGVETRSPLWALIDVYGNCTAIEMIDSRAQLNNSKPSLNNCDVSSDCTDRLIMPMAKLSIHPAHHPEPEPELLLPPHFQPTTGVQLLAPLAFHHTRGRNIRFSNNVDRTVASREETEFAHGYVFTQRPVILDERIVVQVLNIDTAYVGAIAFGLTSCDPANLQSDDLPDDADHLLDRPEYWVVSKDVASCPQRGDELSFCVTHNGEVQISRNGGAPVVFMHVDQSLQLWAFMDVYGSTRKIRLLGSMHPHYSSNPVSRISCSSSPNRAPRIIPSDIMNRASRVNLPHQAPANHQQRLAWPAPPSHHPSARSQNATIILPHPIPAPICHAPVAPASQESPVKTTAEVLQLQQGSSTVLVVNLPSPNYLPGPPRPAPTGSRHSPLPLNKHSPSVASSQQMVELPPTSSGTLMPTYSSDSTYIDEPVISRSSYSTMVSAAVQQWADACATRPNPITSKECSICCERSIDTVLYTCGHMCMCYECAMQQWRGKGDGYCPCCRAQIRDVIRAYQS